MTQALTPTQRRRARRTRQNHASVQTALDAASKIMFDAHAEHAQPLDPHLHKAHKTVSAALKLFDNGKQPALWLRRADLMVQQSSIGQNRKLDAIGRAAHHTETALERNLLVIPFDGKEDLKTMVTLATFAADHGRADYAGRFLALLDELDDGRKVELAKRKALRKQLGAPARNTIKAAELSPVSLKR